MNVLVLITAVIVSSGLKGYGDTSGFGGVTSNGTIGTPVPSTDLEGHGSKDKSDTSSPPAKPKMKHKVKKGSNAPPPNSTARAR